MVSGTHPDDIDLFDYVEDDLSAGRRAELEVHLATCATCAEHVARVRAGRDALQQTHFLELPARRRDAILMSLPAQRPTARRPTSFSAKRLVAVLTPVAAVAAVITVLVVSADFSGNGGGGGSAAKRAPGAGETSGESASGAQAFDRSRMMVTGPASQVADELRRKGFDARVVDGRVEVRNATRAQVESALAHRRKGGVEIVILP